MSAETVPSVRPVIKNAKAACLFRHLDGRCFSYFWERATGLEPATACLGSTSGLSQSHELLRSTDS